MFLGCRLHPRMQFCLRRPARRNSVDLFPEERIARMLALRLKEGFSSEGKTMALEHYAAKGVHRRRDKREHLSEPGH